MIVGQKFLDIFRLHGFKKIFKRVRTNCFEEDAIIDVGHSDWHTIFTSALHEVGNLVILSIDLVLIEDWGSNVADPKFLLLIEGVPNEENLLVMIIEEIIDVDVVLIFPVCFLLEVFKDFFTPFNEHFDFYTRKFKLVCWSLLNFC